MDKGAFCEERRSIPFDESIRQREGAAPRATLRLRGGQQSSRGDSLIKTALYGPLKDWQPYLNCARAHVRSLEAVGSRSRIIRLTADLPRLTRCEHHSLHGKPYSFRNTQYFL
ncbi:hypothetical protein NDU88_006555 [Pleurodeles waltl]|uniref:Uncharacterized protein n=1 Tax=Pleurodeles waltl TaxID=8319 RepID=A0AAV7PJ24_PLEWA|nr:hypothetical protein NDU88_006555 [Pleurodeles waltl]